MKDFLFIDDPMPNNPIRKEQKERALQWYNATVAARRPIHKQKSLVGLASCSRALDRNEKGVVSIIVMSRLHNKDEQGEKK